MNNQFDICPKCGQKTWMMNIYLHMTAPGRFYGHMGKSSIRKRGVKVSAALWETVSWWCSNSKCGHHAPGVKQVRLENVK